MIGDTPDVPIVLDDDALDPAFAITPGDTPDVPIVIDDDALYPVPVPCPVADQDTPPRPAPLSLADRLKLRLLLCELRLLNNQLQFRLRRNSPPGEEPPVMNPTVMPAPVQPLTSDLPAPVLFEQAATEPPRQYQVLILVDARALAALVIFLQLYHMFA